MNDFMLYLKMGLFHVLDIKAYDHILFLIVLAVVFGFVDWKKVFWLVTLFTIGHSISLTLAAFEIIQIKVEIIEFLIPVTIFITGVTNIFNAKKISKTKDSVNLFFALFFGLIHGLGFSNYFRGMIGREDDKLVPLAEFALGIEIAQVIIVLCILILGYVLQNMMKVNKRDWILVTSSIVVGFSIQMMLDRVFW
ncbi:HupE/UreJ family protein [Polaribacter sp. BAL334]|jgi:hydrogenase/urease accessory protein HupE|uniref:HupE/UreJ family protein n=1 Tax=Polaribacter sp. BAL334 TaxID=1708178 RepID=UPI0018D2722E|nr:HupE/UreJ family protein [Polaribacter sp. BAL334]MBG7610912.1 HupE/UreJ family protein [Polaribacter sp. BAL334]